MMSSIRPPYLPVLKWKLGEQQALLALHASVRERILPLLELRSYKKPLTAADFLSTFDRTWKQIALFDCADPRGLLSTWRLATFDGLLARSMAPSSSLVPAINPDDPAFADPTRIHALSKATNGVALRVRATTLDQAAGEVIQHRITSLSNQWLISHVLIDLATTPKLDTSQRQKLADALSMLAKGGITLYLISGCYPNGYTSLGPGLNVVDRSDWLLWQDLVLNHNLAVNVGFGDYTVVAPTWVDKSGGGGVPIVYRYADSRAWQIYKGTSNAGSESIALSNLLITNPAFRGLPCCSTDSTVLGRTTNSVGPGNPAMHIGEGVAHHITLVVREQYP